MFDLHKLIKDNLKYNARTGTLLWLNPEEHTTARPTIHRPKTSPPYLRVKSKDIYLKMILATFIMENPTYRGVYFTHPTSIKQKYLTLNTECILSKYAKEQISWED
tara:strand:+ start:8347 stop:8664 length:318 start_codon:yes stop_codon:yes gene_type:complete